MIADFARDGAFLAIRVLAHGKDIYAGTFGPGLHGGKLYKSANGGETWKDITGDLPRSILDISVDPGDSDNEVDPEDPRVLYACGMGDCTVPDWCMKPSGYTFEDTSGVYRSSDGGATWRQILETGNECRAIRLLPGNSDTLFAAVMDDGLLVSRDGGETWAAINTGLATTILTSCAVQDSYVYAGRQACGVFAGRYNRGAVKWDPKRSNGPNPAVYSLEIQVDPTDSGRIFVGANPGGLYRSDDGGKTFYDKNFLTPSVIVDDPFRQGYYTFHISRRDPSEVWLGTWGKGIYKSYDGMDFNISAHGKHNTMYGKHIYDVLIDPLVSDTVYAACEEGIFRTVDGGISWHAFDDGLHAPQIRILASAGDGRIWAGSKGYGLYSITPGRESTWTQMQPFGQFGTFWPIWNGRPLYQYTSLLIHPQDNAIMYLGTFPAEVYKTIDGGKHWLEHNVGWTNDGVFCLVFHPDNPNIVYAGTYNGLNRSLDAGAHWKMWNEGWPAEQWVFSIAFDPRNPEVMYACSKNGENMGTGQDGFHGTVMKSDDGGAHWFPITEGLNVNQEFYNLIVDPVDPEILYLATFAEGVFISRNAGRKWEPPGTRD